MNYLAHIYLSGNNELVTIGNFMADSIKGSRFKNYEKDIQIGILLHRNIDTFTDAHKTVRLSTKRLHKNYSHYSGVIVDIFYDHFLAKNWSDYSAIPLQDYVHSFYNLLETYYQVLPLKIQTMMPYMIKNNWLYNYGSIEGIAKVLKGMDGRTQNRSGMRNAVNELELYYTDFETEFTAFFEELIEFSKLKYTELNHRL